MRTFFVRIDIEEDADEDYGVPTPDEFCAELTRHLQLEDTFPWIGTASPAQDR